MSYQSQTVGIKSSEKKGSRLIFVVYGCLINLITKPHHQGLIAFKKRHRAKYLRLRALQNRLTVSLTYYLWKYYCTKTTTIDKLFRGFIFILVKMY